MKYNRLKIVFLISEKSDNVIQMIENPFMDLWKFILTKLSLGRNN